MTVLANNAVLITYDAPVPPPPNAQLLATMNGAPIGPFPLGTSTSIFSGGPVPLGTYTVQVDWGGGVVSPVTTFVVSAGGGPRPSAPVMQPAVVFDGNSVRLTWDAVEGAAGYDVEAVFFENGRVFNMSVGPVTSLVVTNVPFGNYLVRVRARNAVGAGPYSNQVLVVIGGTPTIRIRDLEVTLTWNSLADMDLHIIEPSGRHINWNMRNGLTAFLDRDNTTGFGPETAFVHPGGAALGVYQIYIVHYRQDFPTVSTISVTLNVGSPNARTEIFTRQTLAANSLVGHNVALVDVRGGIISETIGARAALSVGPTPVKPE